VPRNNSSFTHLSFATKPFPLTRDRLRADIVRFGNRVWFIVSIKKGFCVAAENLLTN
jgi:hypothetical protein